MKIVKYVNLKKFLRMKKFECLNCGCIFEADKSDYKVDIVSMSVHLIYTECPICKEIVYEEPR